MTADRSPIRRALVSVSDKSNLEILAQALIEHRVEVLSTGGTYRALSELGLAVVKVSEYTGAPEILGGRVKTLHPRIHGGILARPTAEHEAELDQHDIPPIDLVVVNLYPFRETIERPGTSFVDAIENIDIGGPTMVRASAKNWERVTVVVDPRDYRQVSETLAKNDGCMPSDLRRQLMQKAFAHTAAYDAAIATYLSRHDSTGQAIESADLSPALFIAGEPVAQLRYGENPHQPAVFFGTDFARGEAAGLDRAQQHQGKALSYNNLLDADAALNLIRDLAPLGVSVGVFKHLSPCGAAVARAGDDLASVYTRARQADAESAFGGVVSVSTKVDEATAERMVETFLEVILAPGYSAGAREVLGRKKNLRVLELPEIGVPPTGPPSVRMRSVAGGLLVQREDRISVSARNAKIVTKRVPSEEEFRDLDLAQVIGKHVKSNAIVLVKNGVTVGVGGGQTSRVEAARQAARRAGDQARGAVMASDAFFPFRDSIDAAAEVGVAAVVQPGGSKRDQEVVDAADEHGIAMVFTGERHFRH